MKRGHRTFSKLVLLLAVFICWQNLALPGFKFHGQQASHIFNGTSQFHLDNGVTTFSGTLNLASTSTLISSAGKTIAFTGGAFFQGNSGVFMQGTMSTTEFVSLTGNKSFNAEKSTSLSGVNVSGTGNLIDGSLTLSGGIVILNSLSSLTLSIQSSMSQNITLNSGTLTLGDRLQFNDGMAPIGPGTIDCQSYQLAFGGGSGVVSLSTPLVIQNGALVTLNGNVALTNKLRFDNTGVLEGNGNVLDMSGGSTLWVRSGVGLSLQNIEIRGLGGSGGWLLLEDANSTLTLKNVTLQLNAAYTITNGKIYVAGTDSKITTSDKVLAFTNLATLTVDGVSLIYDTLNTPEAQNITPFPVNDVASGVGVNLINGGLIRSVDSWSEDTVNVVLATLNLVRNEDLSAQRKFNFNGSGTVTNMTCDGGNFVMQFPHTVSSVLNVAAAKTVTLQNVVLRDFAPGHISLGAGAFLYFGSNCVIELGDNQALTTSWTFNGGSSIINGKGLNLDLNNSFALVVNPTTTLQIMNTRVTNVGGSNNPNNIRLAGNTATLALRSSQLVLAQNWSFTTGYINCFDNVKLEGPGNVFQFQSANPLTIQSNATLMLDRNITFSYDSLGASKNNLVFTDTSSRLYLNGCTLLSTRTGVSLSGGILVLDDLVTFSSQASTLANAMVLSSTLNIQVMAGAVANVFGYVEYR